MLRVFSRRRAQVEAAVAEREAELGRPSTRAEREAWGAIAQGTASSTGSTRTTGAKR